MAKLVQFERRNRPISELRDNNGGPKILMFTGVRYQRDAHNPQPKASKMTKQKGKVR